MLRSLVRTLIILAAAVAAPAAAAAQAGSVSGRVVDPEGRPLPSATVRVEALRADALSDADGVFRLSRLPAGTYTVEITYIGYEPVQREVAVRADAPARLDVTMETSTIQLDEVVVYGAATRGQAKALQKQKTSPTITNVVSEEFFNRFPDRNAAETLRRLPGISMDRDQGEGEFVQIRGIDQEYNSLTINGVRIPAPDEGDGTRSVGLDLINNNLLGEVEVTKAVSPDMDGDAVGGVVNFGLRSAPSGGIATVNVGLGLNDQTSDFDTYGQDIQDVSFVVGDRWSEGRMGLLVDGAYYKTSRHSKLRELEYDDGDGSVDETIVAQHTNDYDVRRRRFGFSSTADYRFDDASRVYATGSYNVYLDDEVRREVEYLLEDQEELRETRNRVEDQRVALAMMGGEHDLGGLALDYKGAWIKSSEGLPDRTYLRYRRDNPFTGFTNDDIKAFDGTTRFSGLDAPTLDRLRWDDMLKEDADLSGQVNLTVPFPLADGTSSFKFGGKVLRKDVSYERVRFQATDFTRTETLAEGTFGFEDVRYDDARLQGLVTDWGSPRNTDGDYDASETVSALYGMTTLDVDPKLSLVLGARWEHTATDYTQPNPEGQTTPLTGEGEYHNLLPSVHLTYRPDGDTNVRLAYSTGLARPRYEDLVPRRVVDEEDRTIRYGNPDLEARTADNVDVMYERYTAGLGVVTVGGFYKRFKAFHTTRVVQEEIGGVPYTATQTVLGDGTATYLGFEVGFNQRLAFLGGALRDFSLFGNYNYTHSEGEVDGRELQLTNSPTHIANLSLLYDNAPAGFSFVMAANYRDALLIGVGGEPYRDVYFDDELHLDLSVAKAVTSRLTVTAAVNGLTARQEREMLGEPGSGIDRMLQWEEYGPYGTLGFRYVLR